MKAKTIEGMKNELWERAFVNIGDDRERVIALAIHLGEYDFEEVESYIDMDYLVYTDEEADEAVREYIEETVWAFTPSFLQAHTGVSIDTIREMQEKLSEDANEAITAMIKDFDDFVDDAIACDGRGHFLARYDSEENYASFSNEEGKNVTYFIYRVD
tara:strand:- start:38 stop:511 length:474 start_codon:yes stop_codon:yes gene_type:complete